jgi:competence protein CoiA
MLICLLDDDAVLASRNLTRGAEYRCPECKQLVTLKAGLVVTSHFAHRAGAKCSHGKGETPWHRNSKLTIYHALLNAVHAAELECSIGNRRADVVAHDVKTVLEV